jgi:hypothetical protein
MQFMIGGWRVVIRNDLRTWLLDPDQVHNLLLRWVEQNHNRSQNHARRLESYIDVVVGSSMRSLIPGSCCQNESERTEGIAPAAILSSAVVAFRHDTSPVSTFDRIAAHFC